VLIAWLIKRVLSTDLGIVVALCGLGLVLTKCS
jgi:hypothetical protein